MKFIARSAAAVLVLVAIDLASPLTGITLGVNPAGVLSMGIFGIPGLGLLLATQMILE